MVFPHGETGTGGRAEISGVGAGLMMTLNNGVVVLQFVGWFWSTSVS
jgi:hypothetical protein